MTTAAADPVVVAALLDLATEWRFWELVEHRDERIFAGRVGDVRLFGTTMVRIDMPVGCAVTTHGIAADLVAGWVVTSEEEARTAATIIGVPERPLLSDRRTGSPGGIGGDDEPF